MFDQTVSALSPSVAGDSLVFDRTQCADLGNALHESYVHNSPFPHIVIENFMPIETLRRVVSEFPGREEGRFSDSFSKLKTGYQMEKIKSHYINNLISALNSSQFLDFLEGLTGIEGLIPDPHQVGGGLHETARGGHLSIHADFNMHKRMKLRRRVNLILFLNEGWEPSYGGALELWDEGMTACQVSVAPEIGRAVIFNTDSDCLHGHPDPLTCPDDVFRRSLAMYYYTVPEDGIFGEQVRTTAFKARPGTADKVAVFSRTRAIIDDFMPPIVARRLKGRKQKRS